MEGETDLSTLREIKFQNIGFSDHRIANIKFDCCLDAAAS